MGGSLRCSALMRVCSQPTHTSLQLERRADLLEAAAPFGALGRRLLGSCLGLLQAPELCQVHLAPRGVPVHGRSALACRLHLRGGGAASGPPQVCSAHGYWRQAGPVPAPGVGGAHAHGGKLGLLSRALGVQVLPQLLGLHQACAGRPCQLPVGSPGCALTVVCCHVPAASQRAGACWPACWGNAPGAGRRHLCGGRPLSCAALRAPQLSVGCPCAASWVAPGQGWPCSSTALSGPSAGCTTSGALCASPCVDTQKPCGERNSWSSADLRRLGGDWSLPGSARLLAGDTSPSAAARPGRWAGCG